MELGTVSDPFIALEEETMECIGDCNAVSLGNGGPEERHVERVIELLIPGIYFILLGIRYLLLYCH
jgi:hypothetical protein